MKPSKTYTDYDNALSHYDMATLGIMIIYEALEFYIPGV